MMGTIGRLAAVAAMTTAVGAAGLMAPGARAGEISELAAQAEAALEAGRADQALATFDRAAAAYWVATPLVFRAARFVDAVAGFGQYQPRADANFRSGETAKVYVAPVGYGFLANNGAWRVALTTSVEIQTPGGIILARSQDHGQVTWDGRTTSHEVDAKVEVPLPRLAVGDYVLRVTLSDRATSKSGHVYLPFSIVE